MNQPSVVTTHNSEPVDTACGSPTTCSCGGDTCATHSCARESASALPLQPTATWRYLAELPLSERADALEAMVMREFKGTLLMAEDDDLPLDGSFFDLGLTSLRVTEVKQRIEELLGRGINANVLFNQPTLAQLMAHLTGEVLVELFPRAEEDPVDPAAAAGPDAQWHDVLDELYRT